MMDEQDQPRDALPVLGRAMLMLSVDWGLLRP
jgi:hypothetical protein